MAAAPAPAPTPGAAGPLPGPAVELPRPELLATAAELLRQPEVQAAPLERRVQFLRAKGLDVGEICRAFEQADQAVDLPSIEGALAALPRDAAPSPVWTALGTLSDVVKLVGYAGMAAWAVQRWFPFTVSVDPAFYEPDQPSPEGKEEPAPGPLVGNWYDLHAADLPKTEETPGTESGREELEKQLQESKHENSNLRLEVAKLTAQLRTLQRKATTAAAANASSGLGGLKSAEDLLKPLPASPPTTLPPTAWEEPSSPAAGGGAAAVGDGSVAEPAPAPAPADPDTDGPGGPGPADPVTDRPADPVTDRPADPVTDRPADPATDRLADPDHAPGRLPEVPTDAEAGA
eukprot:EG_transcript_16511